MLQSFYKVYFISCFCFIAHFLHSQENVQFSYISYVSSSGNIESEYPNTLKLNKNRDLTKIITEQLKTIDSRAYNLLFDNSDQSNNGTLSLVIAVDKERVYTFGYLDNQGVEIVQKLIESLKRANKTIILFSDNNILSNVVDESVTIGN